MGDDRLAGPCTDDVGDANFVGALWLIALELCERQSFPCKLDNMNLVMSFVKNYRA